MALFKILKGNKENLPELKKEGFAYFTIDENDFYVDTQSSDMDTNGNFLFDNVGKPIGGTRKQLNANRAHYVKSKDLHKNSTFDQLYIDDEEISLGRTAGESAYEGGHVEGGSGLRSIAVGSNVSATGNYSQAFGSNTSASELNATAFGKDSIASGEASFVEGIDTEADHDGAHAEGISTKSLGDATHAEGYLTKAENYYSHAEGSETHANGLAAHAEGSGTKALNEAAHAEGNLTTASGKYSHAGGNLTDTNKYEGAFVHGFHVSAEADYQTVFGKYSNAVLTDAFVIGVGTSEEDYGNGFSVDWDGHATLKDSLLVGRDPVLNLEVATKQYVDVKVNAVRDDKLFSYTTQLVADSSTIEFNDSKIDVNKCLVYYNGLLLILGENYAVSDAKTIVLNGWSANAGDFFTLVGSPVGLDTTNASLGNDYAEYRSVTITEPGRCVVEAENGIMVLSTERMQPGAEIVSDTFGHSIGKIKGCETPIAISGRVLAYPNEELDTYTLGCAVCSGPNGTISQMTREEIKEYPERIIGTVSELPKYESWNGISVNGRIWIRVR